MSKDLEIIRKIKRICYIENNICHIPLSNGEVALCDEDRINEVNKYNWCVKKTNYSHTVINKKYITLHKFLYPRLKLIDHINGNKLDNRSCNLREATNAQNCSNCKIYSNNTTGYKGVCFHKKQKNFQAQIKNNGKIFYIGCFKTAKEAARAYDKKAKELHGIFANLNFKVGEFNEK